MIINYRSSESCDQMVLFVSLPYRYWCIRLPAAGSMGMILISSCCVGWWPLSALVEYQFPDIQAEICKVWKFQEKPPTNW